MGTRIVHGMLQAEAGAYLGGNGADRVVLKGPEILLEPHAFTTVALVIHEMITNSAKYGALSDRRGRVEIETAIDPCGRLIIDWSEHGGPRSGSRRGRGFGSTVIETSIRHDLQGDVELDLAATGLRARFTIPPAQFRVSTDAARGSGQCSCRRGRKRGDAEGRAAGRGHDDHRPRCRGRCSALGSRPCVSLARRRGAQGDRRASSDFALLDVNLGARTALRSPNA